MAARWLQAKLNASRRAYLKKKRVGIDNRVRELVSEGMARAKGVIKEISEKEKRISVKSLMEQVELARTVKPRWVADPTKFDIVLMDPIHPRARIIHNMLYGEKPDEWHEIKLFNGLFYQVSMFWQTDSPRTYCFFVEKNLQTGLIKKSLVYGSKERAYEIYFTYIPGKTDGKMTWKEAFLCEEEEATPNDPSPRP